MTDTDCINSTEIERHIDQVLGDVDKFGLPLVRDVLQEPRDRWYGQLMISVYDSLSDNQNSETVLPAAAAIELLRGSVRLRSRMLVTLTDNHTQTLTQEPTTALLAGDYLYTAAFSSLHSVPDSRVGDCFKLLTTVLRTITETFAYTYTSDRSTDDGPTTFLDETAGSLGEGAAALGSILAGTDERNRRHVVQFGHGLSIERQINHILDADPNEAMVIPPTFDEAQFRMHAERRRDDANQALDALSKSADVTHLRGFSEATADTSTTRHVIEQRAYDPAAGPDLTTVIVEAVAAAEGVEMASIKQPSLYEVVDIEAVEDALFGATGPDTRGVTGGSLDFEYRGYQITVHIDGWVQVVELANQ
ncbi:HalOD1 output domain-containing protein [Halorubrum trueperi]|uniref:HalOD1 output domain-containing protein n=1 Tax=Halorubrum trueperi TaxID=2004704 RepID=A0ABD5UIX3_9EURY